MITLCELDSFKIKARNHLVDVFRCSPYYYYTNGFLRTDNTFRFVYRSIERQIRVDTSKFEDAWKLL